MLTLVAPLVAQNRVVLMPGPTVAGLAKKAVITGGFAGTTVAVAVAVDVPKASFRAQRRESRAAARESKRCRLPGWPASGRRRAHREMADSAAVQRPQSAGWYAPPRLPRSVE